MKEIETIDRMIITLRDLKKAIKKQEQLSDKAFNCSHQTHSAKQVEKAHTDLNWQCMHVDKSKVSFARMFKKSFLDVDVGEKEYNPSGFHSYKY